MCPSRAHVDLGQGEGAGGEQAEGGSIAGDDQGAKDGSSLAVQGCTGSPGSRGVGQGAGTAGARAGQIDNVQADGRAG